MGRNKLFLYINILVLILKQNKKQWGPIRCSVIRSVSLFLAKDLGRFPWLSIDNVREVLRRKKAIVKCSSVSVVYVGDVATWLLMLFDVLPDYFELEFMNKEISIRASKWLKLKLIRSHFFFENFKDLPYTDKMRGSCSEYSADSW